MTNDRQAFIVSIALHLAALAVVAAFVFINPLKEKDRPIVLELVALPEDTPAADTPAPPQPKLDQPQFTPPKARELPKIDIPEPEPEPTPPPPQSKPEPKPEPKVEPKPEPKPEPAKPEVVNLQDFLKKHGKPDQVKRDKPKPKQPAPRINTKGITESLSKITIESAPSSSKASPLIAQYQARLRQSIEVRWSKPVAGSGDEWAEVHFAVATNGTISNVRIVKFNGSDAFVASIRQAIQSTPSIGPRPSGWNGEMEIVFRLQ